MSATGRGEPVPRGRTRRVLPIATLTGRTAGETVVAAMQDRLGGTGDRRDAALERAAGRYAELLGRSRGVLMKAGQILSFISLIDDDEPEWSVFRTALARLQSDAPPMDFADVETMLREELGGPAEEMFAEFGRRPFAAASIGQVHRARTHDGRDVAVKVQYPGVEAAIRDDLANVELLATLLRLGGSVAPGMPRLDTHALAAEVAARIGEEIDYRAEAANQLAFADAYRGHPFARIPEVVPELSTSRVLTMEYVDGLTWAQAVGREKPLRDRWGEVIFRFAWTSLRRLRLANVDPHPGNYLFHTDGTVTFLDFGCVKRYEPSQVDAMRAMERAGTLGDAEGHWRAGARLGFVSDGGRPDPGELLGLLSPMWRPMTDPQPFTYTREFATAAVRHLYSPFGTYSTVLREMDLPPDFTMFLRMDSGLTAVLGALGATGQWRAISEEMDEVAPPATELGRLDDAFWNRRPSPAGGVA